MVPPAEWALFAGTTLLLVLTPGPNMIYLLSRAVCQGRAAGVVSLAGVVTGFLVHVLATTAGLTAVFMALPLAWEALKWAGAAYLGWLAWQSVRPGARSPLEPAALPPDPPRRLFAMGLVTSVLNPKVAVFYLSILPQFVSPANGSVFAQGLQLGVTQIAVSFSVNLAIVLFAARIAAGLARRPRWLAVQRWVMGGVLAALALRLALEQRRA